MRIYDKGAYRDMTPEELAAAQNAPAPEPGQTPEEIIAELRAEVAAQGETIDELLEIVGAIV